VQGADVDRGRCEVARRGADRRGELRAGHPALRRPRLQAGVPLPEVPRGVAPPRKRRGARPHAHRRLLRDRRRDGHDPQHRRGAGDAHGPGHPPDLRGSLSPGPADALGPGREHDLFAGRTVKAMLLAAGYGTRFQPVTLTLPKPLIPVCNRPLIGWPIQSFLAQGIRDFVVNLHHHPDSIRDYLLRAYPQARFELSLEQEILGTGGGVRRARPLLDGEDEFFLANGDTIQTVPVDALRRARGDALAALTLRHPPPGDHFTPVFHENGRVTGFGSGTG